MKKNLLKIIILILIVLIVIIYTSVCRQKLETADIILKNGMFFTVNKENPFAEAVAIRGNKILFVGFDAEVDRYSDAETVIIDLKGRFGCPGFNDACMNLSTVAMRDNVIDLRGVTTTRDIQIKISKAVRSVSNEEWIIGRGWDQTLLNTDGWPDRRILDRISPNIPMILYNDDGHAALVNSKALRIARLLNSTSNPPGGQIMKNSRTGRTTGILTESAIDLVSQFVPEPSPKKVEEKMIFTVKKAVSMGITTIQDKSSGNSIEIFSKLNNRDEKPLCRISQSFHYIKDLKGYRERLNDRKDDLIKLGCLRIDIDGSIKTRTALLSRPYNDNPSTYGVLHIDYDRLNKLVIRADKENIPIEIHAGGDAAVKMALDAFEFAYLINGIKERSFRIEGIEIFSRKLIPIIHELNIISVVQPYQCIDGIRWMEERVGSFRSTFVFPWKSVKSSGVLAFGSGWPDRDMNPMLGIYAAVTRHDTSGYPYNGWFSEEKLTVQDAIEAYTLGSASAELMANIKGSIESGKLADIVILDGNLLEMPFQDILNVNVVYTIVNGRIVYKSPDIKE